MRLTPQQREAIRALVHEPFGPDARALVFGSRARDDLRGGDLDLLVQTPHDIARPALAAAQCAAAVSRVLSGRSVDVVLHSPLTTEQSHHRVALATGVPL